MALPSSTFISLSFSIRTMCILLACPSHLFQRGVAMEDGETPGPEGGTGDHLQASLKVDKFEPLECLP